MTESWTQMTEQPNPPQWSLVNCISFVQSVILGHMCGFFRASLAWLQWQTQRYLLSLIATNVVFLLIVVCHLLKLSLEDNRRSSDLGYSLGSGGWACGGLLGALYSTWARLTVYLHGQRITAQNWNVCHTLPASLQWEMSPAISVMLQKTAAVYFPVCLPTLQKIQEVREPRMQHCPSLWFVLCCFVVGWLFKENCGVTPEDPPALTAVGCLKDSQGFFSVVVQTLLWLCD